MCKTAVAAGLWNSLWLGRRDLASTTHDLASRPFVVNANLSSSVSEIGNFDTDELEKIVANAVSNFLNRPGQNSENSASANPSGSGKYRVSVEFSCQLPLLFLTIYRCVILKTRFIL